MVGTRHRRYSCRLLLASSPSRAPVYRTVRHRALVEGKGFRPEWGAYVTPGHSGVLDVGSFRPIRNSVLGTPGSLGESPRLPRVVPPRLGLPTLGLLSRDVPVVVFDSGPRVYPVRSLSRRGPPVPGLASGLRDPVVEEQGLPVQFLSTPSYADPAPAPSSVHFPVKGRGLPRTSLRLRSERPDGWDAESWSGRGGWPYRWRGNPVVLVRSVARCLSSLRQAPPVPCDLPRVRGFSRSSWSLSLQG